VSPLLWSATLVTKDTDSTLGSELEALHAKWFHAFDTGDGITMDQRDQQLKRRDWGAF
jgi:hypothetical protein